MAEIKKIKVGTTEYNITDSNAIHGIKSINTTNTSSLATASSESIAGSGTFNLHKVSKTGKFSDLNGRGEEYLEWGGTSHSGNISPIGMSLSAEHSANRVALINSNALTFEYSSDGGATWTAYSVAGAEKTKFCTTSLSLPIGRPNNSTNLVANKSKTRITITAQDGTHGYVYTSLKKMLVQVSTATALSLLVETRTGTNYKNNGAWSSIGTYNLSGWSGWNDIPTIFSLGGGSTQTSNNWQMRLTITCTTVSSSYPKTAEVLGIRLFGDNCWTQASNLAGTGNIYTYDMSGNVTFPSEVSATTYYAKNSSGAWKELVLDDDSRLTNPRPASDVYAWAKSSTKPSYTASEVGVTESKFPGIMKTGTVKSVSVKINGAVKGTVTDSGTIDLGTYLTSHQPLTNYVTLNTAQTITGVKTFNAPKSASGEQATATFKTANGGQIIFGKEGPNSGSMIALDQVVGTRRLNFRASATPGAIVWSQPESNSSLYYDVTNVYFRGCTHVSFNSASTITLNKFTSASALGTDANGNLKKVSLAKVATSGSYNDLSGVPTLSTVAKTGSYNDLSNKPNAVTYSTSGGNYYLWSFGGRYKISAPGSLQGDGTYKDVTIITSENLSSQGLFVPMVGTGSTPMSGDIQIKGEYEATNASSGPILGGSGQTHTSPRNSDLSLGLKGISYHYYGNDNTYGSSGNYTYGLCYKAMETAGGSYSKLDYLLDAGLTVFWYGGSSNTNPSLSNITSTTMTYDGKLTLREGTSTTIKSIKNLMEKMEISGIDGTGYATYGYVKDEMTGLMICYGTTGQVNGAGVSVTFSATFKGAPTVVVVPYVKSLSETSIVSQYRNSATIRCYIDSAGSRVNNTGSGSAIKGFTLDTGNGEYQYFNYIAIGQYK